MERRLRLKIFILLQDTSAQIDFLVIISENCIIRLNIIIRRELFWVGIFIFDMG